MTLIEGQSDLLLKLRVDYKDGSQVSESFLQNAQKLEILYRFEKEDPSKTDVTGTWSAYYEFEDSTPYLCYEFIGLDLIPNDAEGFLNVRAKITDSDGRASLGSIAHIKIVRDELI